MRLVRLIIDLEDVDNTNKEVIEEFGISDSEALALLNKIEEEFRGEGYYIFTAKFKRITDYTIIFEDMIVQVKAFFAKILKRQERKTP